MPYIKVEYRDNIDNEIGLLAGGINEMYELGVSERAGLMNYAITKLILSVYPDSKQNYHGYNEVMGMLESCKQEYYRKYVAPYENQKEFENGSV